MKISVTSQVLHPRHAFRIARARRREVRNVFLCVEQDGVEGWGEASPNAYYAETAEDVIARLQALQPMLRAWRIESREDVEKLWEEAWTSLQPSRAAQCALDLALWDLLGKSLGRPVAELAWDRPARSIRTFGTIGLSSPDELAEKLLELRGWPWIKVKSDHAASSATVSEVRRAMPEAIVAVDANAAWTCETLAERIEELRSLGIRFLEQPLAPTEDLRLRAGSYPLPLYADESCVVEADVARISPHYDGVNVKLVKCGGLTPALRMVQEAKRLGRGTMVGCMLESSLLIAAGYVVAQATDWADLDGAWLLGDDPYTGMEVLGGEIAASAAPGLGVTRRQ